MSFEELKQLDIFLPKPVWGDLELTASVNVPLLVTVFAVGAVGCVMMVLGGGKTLTWIGAALFIAFMIGFTVVSLRGIERQNRRIDELNDDHSNGHSQS